MLDQFTITVDSITYQVTAIEQLQAVHYQVTIAGVVVVFSCNDEGCLVPTESKKSDLTNSIGAAIEAYFS